MAFNPVNRVQNRKDATKRDHFRTTITGPSTGQWTCKAHDVKLTAEAVHGMGRVFLG